MRFCSPSLPWWCTTGFQLPKQMPTSFLEHVWSSWRWNNPSGNLVFSKSSDSFLLVFYMMVALNTLYELDLLDASTGNLCFQLLRSYLFWLAFHIFVWAYYSLTFIHQPPRLRNKYQVSELIALIGGNHFISFTARPRRAIQTKRTNMRPIVARDTIWLCRLISCLFYL